MRDCAAVDKESVGSGFRSGAPLIDCREVLARLLLPSMVVVQKNKDAKQMQNSIHQERAPPDDFPENPFET